jgi:hypothetical protein
MSEETVELKEVVASRKEFERVILAKAMEDDAFRKALLENPREVFEKELGQKLPAELEVKVVEESHNTIYIAVPPKPMAQEELSDEALEKAAGGIIASRIPAGRFKAYGPGGAFSRILISSSKMIRR